MTTFFKRLLFLCPIIFFCTCSFGQAITGTWQGSLNIQGNQLPIIFHVTSDSTNKLITTFDSPNQKAFNLKCSQTIIKGDSVIFMIALINGKYAGLLSIDKKQITGSWFQGGGSLPLTITKTSETVTLKQQKRPQTPKPLFGYHADDVEYFNADKSMKYSATLTYPEASSASTFPAVILITGSGQQDRDETLYGHKPFAVIADYLTKQGFAVLRVDDRGVGKTTGDFNIATTLDFAKDVEAGLDFLEHQPMINKEKIGLIGHSEGGMIAPIVAGERKEVKYIVMLAGPGVPISELMREQAEAIIISEGGSPAEAKARIFQVNTIWAEMHQKEDSATMVKNIRTKIDTWNKTLDTATLAKMRRTNKAPINDQIAQGMAALNTNWYKYFIAFNPQPYLQKLSCKVLALNGSKDVQVPAVPNLAGIRSALKKSKSPQYDVIELPGLNHFFQTCNKCSPSEYDELEETFSPKALAIMGNWLQKNVQ